ncbi:MAG TPA: cyclic nucleotide-binding domain-containing protein [Bacillota bacterium]
MKDFPVQTFYKNQVIFEEGTPANVAYLLKAGRVELSVQGKEKVVLAELKPGDIFGETALLLREGRRTETAVALEEAGLIVIYRTAFQEYLEQ